VERAEWAVRTRKTAGIWLQAISSNSDVPEPVQRIWQSIAKALDQPVGSLSDSRRQAGPALLELLAIADEACSPLVRKPPPVQPEFDPAQTALLFAEISFNDIAERTLRENRQSSLCREIHPSRLRVLPKFKAPQRGLTLRSLSLFAGLAESAEIEARFSENPSAQDKLTLNLLIVPWPFEVWPAQFRPSEPLATEMRNMPAGFGFFTYQNRAAGSEFAKGIASIVQRAERECGKIAMLVLPEAAISDQEANKLQQALSAHDCGLIAGIGEAAKPGQRHGINGVRLYSPGLELDPVNQGKHHRWQLDRAQIVQYSLGHSLHHERRWWEHIDVTNRRLEFVRRSRG
jgi:hypothetical protein